jgi:hypothetical protein
MNTIDPALDEEVEAAIEDAYGPAESWLERRLVDVRDTIREEPIKTTLIAMAIGAVLGRFFWR